MANHRGGYGFLVLTLALCFAGLGLADTIVLPAGYTGVEGPGSVQVGGSNGGHIQEILDSSLFAALGDITITGITLRADESNLVASGTATLGITLYTTTLAPAAISTTFANNTGSNAVTLYSAPYTFNTTTTGAGPRPFDVFVPFSTPYTYNPGSGLNLLLDVTTSNAIVSGGNVMLLDAAFLISNSGISFVGGRNGDATALVSAPGGLVAELLYEPVPTPEPATLVLFGSGLIGFSLLRRRRKA